MYEFIASRAGRQFLALAGIAIAIWLPGVIFHADLFAGVRQLSGPNIDVFLLTLTVGGGISFIYSMLRIFDLRKEMVQRRAAEHKADWIATHDQLTRLPNRYAFERVDLRSFFGDMDTNGVQISAPTVTIFSIDLDGFKKVNDLVGHHGGDLLLSEVAKRLCQFAATPNVFRFGGDEFIVIARNLPVEREEKYAQLLIQLITRPIPVGDLATEVGASIGYARWPMQGATLEEVSHKSDVALYEAKSRGPNRAFLFSDEMQHRVAKRAQLEGKLRKAIESGDIRPFYQPLIDLKSGAVCGFEALARWTDDEGHAISPQVFITVAEETGLVTRLFQQLLAQAARDACGWPEDIGLSFNVSPVQMEDRLLASRILDVLSANNLAPHRLEVEITENALMQDPELAAEVIQSLHDAGIQIALDDFGTGYSSLSQLARYKFDKVKIDKSFVATFADDERQEKIVQAMLGLSKSLNLKTTVEGIEEHTQLGYFLKQGCDVGQGYLFGKAMPAEDALSFLHAHRQTIKSA
ncbi:putative bifunctional diguanylate cyclase/phosphodiesterase [Rhizobium halophytocola]|uniref:Diguanylate cyclase (GGDEF)-like protein n=1 Tax=Rhizobium halophytocola TaxID=735519 RepID=A0ABS4DVF9_9HYPH|nr:EAL domain-containing protein [Rhizobium halophytocola]MBP1849667.1 diguanylate cyclase (GGDEF)-like protein [Rhizobium halophytocola]